VAVSATYKLITPVRDGPVLRPSARCRVTIAFQVALCDGRQQSSP